MNNDSFKDTQKVAKRAFGVFLAIWVASALVGLAALAGIVYVAIHFIQKAW